MKITLSKYAGFCDGVERAYDMVKKIALDPDVKKPVFILGSLVHNEDVVKSLEKLGIKKISARKKDAIEALDAVKEKIGTLVISAHGVGPGIYDYAKRNKIKIIDTTCPRVIKAQRLAKNFLEKSYQIVIVGEKGHKEVKGIYEWANKKAVFVEKMADLKKIKLDPAKKIAVISQTTQNRDFVRRACDFIKKKYKKTEILDTICLATQNRQDEVKNKAGKNGAVVVVGSPESANSNRLWEIAKAINPRSYFIEKAGQIKKIWFRDCRRVWVTAGASTPDWIINEVLKSLKN